jgi:hypothetical protein
VFCDSLKTSQFLDRRYLIIKPLRQTLELPRFVVLPNLLYFFVEIFQSRDEFFGLLRRFFGSLGILLVDLIDVVLYLQSTSDYFESINIVRSDNSTYNRSID